jgi:hypothetical protein
MIVITPNNTFGPYKSVVTLPLGLMCDDALLPFTVIGETYMVSLDDSEVTMPVVKPPVPESVTMLQASLALYNEGSLKYADNFIANLQGTEGDQARIIWTRAGTVKRAHPLVAVLGQVLNKTDEQLDDLFRLAATYETDK